MAMESEAKQFSLGEKLFAHFEAWRVYSLLWSGLVSLVGACVAFKDFPPIHLAFMVFFIPVFGWIAALYAMDYFDKDLDVIEKPIRPIPSGRIKPYEAIICAFIFATIGLILCFFLSLINLFIIFLVSISVIIYTKISKARGLLQNVNRGLITWITFFFGYFAITTNISQEILLFSLIFFMHDSSTNIIGALRDRKGDKKGGFRTTPVRYGVKNSLIISLFFTIIFISIIVYNVFINSIIQYQLRFYMIFIFSILCLITLYTIGFNNRDMLDRKKSLQLHSLFVIERSILACAFIAAIVEKVLISVLIILIIVPSTILLQLIFRKRYELLD